MIGIAKGAKCQHRNALDSLLKQTKGPVRIASAYVTDTQLLSNMHDRDICLLTYIERRDIVSGATNLDSLAALIKVGVQCRWLCSGPRLHAKVYLFGDQSAVVTSANLTTKALNDNIEVGVALSSVAAKQLIRWFSELWDEAIPLDLATVSKWRKDTKDERVSYLSRQNSEENKPLLPAHDGTALFGLTKSAKRFFVCNTNRRYSPNKEDEKAMHERGYATAWIPFMSREKMRQVEKGDVIFMYANGNGIIGVGRVTGPCEILKPNDVDRVQKVGDTAEWRVPAVWLAWTDERHAYKWQSSPGTFFEVSGEKYHKLHCGVEEHFLLQQRDRLARRSKSANTQNGH
jgi:hypothetical protein